MSHLYQTEGTATAPTFIDYTKNSETSADKSAAFGAALNSKDNLQRFIEGSSLGFIETLSGEKIHVMASEAPHSLNHLLIVAEGPHTLDFPEEDMFKGEKIYDFSQEAQEAYWGTILTSIRQMWETYGTDHVITSQESVIPRVMNPDEHTARSLRATHTHINAIKPTDIVASKVTAKRLEEERDLLIEDDRINNMLAGLGGLAEDHRLTLGAGKFTHRKDSYPYGYEIDFVSPLEDINIPAFTNFMRQHYESYTRNVGNLTTDVDLAITQPAFRLYFTVNEQNNLKMIVSPNLITNAGALAAAGVKLERQKQEGPEAKSYQDFKEDLWLRLAGKVIEKLNGKTK